MKENCWWNIAHSTNHQPLHHQTHHTINGPNRCTACTLINRWPTFTRNQQLTTSVWVSQWVSGWVSEWIPATDTGASTVQQTRNYQHSCITTLTRLDQTTKQSFIHSIGSTTPVLYGIATRQHNTTLHVCNQVTANRMQGMVSWTGLDCTGCVLCVEVRPDWCVSGVCLYSWCSVCEDWYCVFVFVFVFVLQVV